MKQQELPSETVRKQALQRLRKLFSVVPDDVSLADELIAERRAEAHRDEP